MNILYLHGFRSTGRGNTASYLAKTLKDHKIFSPDLPTKISESIDFINNYIKENNINIIIGTSLGGLFARHIRLPKLMINPAFKTNIESGTYQYYGLRKDGKKNCVVDEHDIEYIKQLQLTSKEQELEYINLSYLLIGRNDDVVSLTNYDKYTNLADKFIYADFGHRLDNNIIDKHVVPIINQIIYNMNILENYQIIPEL